MVSFFSISIALILTTGNFGCNSFNFYSTKYPSFSDYSQEAPSKNKPCIKAPSSGY